MQSEATNSYCHVPDQCLAEGALQVQKPLRQESYDPRSRCSSSVVNAEAFAEGVLRSHKPLLLVLIPGMFAVEVFANRRSHCQRSSASPEAFQYFLDTRYTNYL